MKRLLLASFLMIAGGTMAIAQNANPTTAGVTTENSKRMFTSKVNEWSAHLSRGKADFAQKIFMDIAGMMQNRIADDNRALSAATSDADKSALKTKIKAEQDMYAEIKMMSIDMTKNAGDMKTKLMSFANNY